MNYDPGLHGILNPLTGKFKADSDGIEEFLLMAVKIGINQRDLFCVSQ